MDKKDCTCASIECLMLAEHILLMLREVVTIIDVLMGVPPYKAPDCSGLVLSVDASWRLAIG